MSGAIGRGIRVYSPTELGPLAELLGVAMEEFESAALDADGLSEWLGEQYLAVGDPEANFGGPS